MAAQPISAAYRHIAKFSARPYVKHGRVCNGRGFAFGAAAEGRGQFTRKQAMKGFKEQNLDERLKRAADAKRAILEKFKSRPGLDDPEVAKRREERMEIAAARAAREAEKRRIKEQEAAERAAKEATQRAEREQREKWAAIEKVIRDAAEAAERKAERDRRYAARKSRQKR
jgi:hypothetical protein